MKKRSGMAVLVLLLACSWAQAQKNVIKLGRNVSRGVARATEQQFLKSVPARTLSLYGLELRALVASNRLPANAFPKLARRNDLLTHQAVNLFVSQEKLFLEQAPLLVEKIESRVYNRVPYAALLPKDAEVLYIGEIHGVPRVQQEIVTLVKSLRTVYPGRNIYLAAEGVPASFDLDYSTDDLIYTQEALLERLHEAAELADMEMTELVASSSVVLAAVEAGIPVLGLESEGALCRLATPKGRKMPTEEEYQQVVTSLAGMEFRNRGFAKGINVLRKADPDALIVVYGGIDHLAYHQLSSVPALVGGKSFVVQVTVPAALAESNLLFRHFKEPEEIRRAFNASPDAKLAEYWKEPTSFNQLLGNDLTVIVHE